MRKLIGLTLLVGAWSHAADAVQEVNPALIALTRVIQEDREFVSDKWKKQSLIHEKEISSYVPIWFVEEDTTTLYLVFGDEFRFTSKIQVIGTLRSPHEDRREFVPFGSIRTANKNLSIAARAILSNGPKANEYMNPSDSWDYLLALSKTYGGTPIVLLERGDLVYALAYDIKPDLPLKPPPSICAEWHKRSAVKDCKKANQSDLKDLADIFFQEMMQADNLHLVEHCSNEFDQERDPRCYAYYSTFTADDIKQAKSRFAFDKKILEERLFYEKGYYELIGGSDTDSYIFSERYNYLVLNALHERGVIKSNGFGRIKAGPVIRVIEKNFYKYVLVGIIFGVIILLTSEAYLVLSFFSAHLLFFVAAPDPFVGLGVANIGPLLYSSLVEQFYFDYPNYGKTILIWFVFIPYWFFTHKAIKKIISSWDKDKQAPNNTQARYDSADI